MEFTIEEWAKIANALRVAATVNDAEGPRDTRWFAEATMQRSLAERIEIAKGV